AAAAHPAAAARLAPAAGGGAAADPRPHRLRRGGAGGAALPPPRRLGGRAGLAGQPGKPWDAAGRCLLPGVLPPLPADRLPHRRALPAAGLSDGARHCRRPAILAAALAAAGAAALPDGLPAAGRRLDRAAARRRLGERRARPRRGRAVAAALQRPGALSRHGACLPAIRRAAARHGAAAARPLAGGGGGRSGGDALHRLPQRHLAAVAAGGGLGLPAGLHPGRGGVRHPRAARPAGGAARGTGALGRVLPEPGLAAGRGPGARPAGGAAAADPALPAPGAAGM
ncbi:MAG: Putrescine transport system permease protein PotH, partial [uncultured Craurococcus sp.]